MVCFSQRRLEHILAATVLVVSLKPLRGSEMKDKEVGELWKEIYSDENCITNEEGACYSDCLCPHHPDYPRVVALIRKLVEERALKYDSDHIECDGPGMPCEVSWNRALRDFCMDDMHTIRRLAKGE